MPIRPFCDRWPQDNRRLSEIVGAMTDDAYHCGELSQTLGIARLPQIDFWRPD